jgi:hypothetical protein
MGRANWLTPPFGNPLAGVARFLLFDYLTSRLLATAADADRTMDIAGLLPDGRWTLALARQDVYGSVSDLADVDAQLIVLVTGGTPATEMADPADVSCRAVSAGSIEVTWHLHLTHGQVVPAEFEIGDAGNVLDTATGGRRGPFTATVGPFTHGQTIRPQVRASDGAGGYGPWIDAEPQAIVADAQGPMTPTLVTA